MHAWSFDILRQGPFGWWLWICLAAAVALAGFAAFDRRRLTPTTGRGLATILLVALGVGGTLLVLALPPLHSAKVGLVWTFVMLAAVSACFYLNLADELGSRRTGWLLSLRVIALLLLVPMLFEPVVHYVARPTPETPLVFLVDTSGSMSVPDVQNGPSRLQSVVAALGPQLPAINEHFVPRFFTFSTSATELKTANVLSTAKADGPATDIIAGLTKTLQAVNQPDAQFVLVSDGIDNTSPDVVGAARESQRPIHTVRVGSDQAEPATLANVAVDDVQAPDDFVFGSETKIHALIRSTALANRLVQVKLGILENPATTAPADNPQSTLHDPTVLASAPLVLQPTPDGQTVDLPFKPKATGVQHLVVWIDPIVGERTTVDNRQELQGLALDPRIKVLYVEGRARPEYKPLKFALDRDPNVELATLLRTTQNSFDASGTVAGTPLKKMPQTADEWKQFDVILLGDLDASFLTKLQQAAIEQACNSGAGVMMLGGQNNFATGGYKGTPIEQLLPVQMGDPANAQERSPFVPRLTAEGSTHPAMEGLTDWFGVDQKLPTQTLKPLLGNVIVGAAKGGASVLMVHADKLGPDGKPQIVLAVQRFGDGRSAAFTVDTTYLWYLPMRGLGQDSPYNKLWGQMIRWLAGIDVRDRSRGPGLEALISKSVYSLGQSVTVRGMVRDDKGDATRYAQVSLALTTADGKNARQFNLSPVDTHTGMYRIEIPSLPKGEYVATLTASKDGKPLGSTPLHFSVIAPADEMLHVAANPQLLRSIATATNGYAYDLDHLPNLIDQIIKSQPNAGNKEETVPLASFVRASLALVGNAPNWPGKYDLPLQALLAMGFLVAEWVTRRRWQLT